MTRNDRDMTNRVQQEILSETRRERDKVISKLESMNLELKSKLAEVKRMSDTLVRTQDENRKLKESLAQKDSDITRLIKQLEKQRLEMNISENATGEVKEMQEKIKGLGLELDQKDQIITTMNKKV